MNGRAYKTLMRHNIRRHSKSQQGASSIEYVLLAVCIALAALVTLAPTGTSISDRYASTESAVQDAL